jgi:multidrug resistance efflux pump
MHVRLPFNPARNTRQARIWLIWVAAAILASCTLAGDGSSIYEFTADELSLRAEQGIKLKGRLIPQSYVELAFAAPSRASQVLIQEGDRVEAGVILIRNDQYHARQAELARAELEHKLAEQALEDLYRQAELALAQAQVEVANAENDLAFAQDRVDSLHRPRVKLHIDQAYANLLLAEKQRDQTRADLLKAQQQYRNKKHILWRFLNQRQFRLRLTILESELAVAERRVVDAQKKYTDLLAPVDAIDLAIAEAGLAKAQARLLYAIQDRDKKSLGPNPDELEIARARLNAAKASLAAAQAAIDTTVLKAPISGEVVELAIQPGEWMPAGQNIVILADLNQWIIETENLEEVWVPQVTNGQSAQLSIWALPDLSLRAAIEKINLFYQEEDGDITYTARLSVDGDDPRLAWGMTVDIVLEP